MTITPEQLAKAGSEHAHQTALFCWAALPDTQALYPMLRFMFAIPNGGSRGDDRIRARKIGGELKAEGVKPGVPDVCLPYPKFPYHGLWIEMKVGNNKPSDEQVAYLNQLNEWGYCVKVCYSWVEATHAIVDYLG